MLRLAKLALHAAAQSGGSDAATYRAPPPARDELSSEEEPLAWEAAGRDEFNAAR
jgi:hypothetical protein